MSASEYSESYLSSLSSSHLLSQIAVPGGQLSDLLVSVHHLLQLCLESPGDGMGCEVKQQMEIGLIHDVVVGESSSILQLLTSKDKFLPDNWDSFFILNNNVCKLQR